QPSAQLILAEQQACSWSCSTLKCCRISAATIFRNCAGSSAITRSSTLSPFSSHLAYMSSMNCCPSLLREPLGRPFGLPLSPSRHGARKLQCFYGAASPDISSPHSISHAVALAVAGRKMAARNFRSPISLNSRRLRWIEHLDQPRSSPAHRREPRGGRKGRG